MRISPQYGTKEKLFEMFNKINHLNENLSNSQEDKSEIIDNFIRYVGKKLNIDNKLPAISVNYKEGIAKENKSFGGYNPETETIEIIANKRNLADVLRTLAHEMVHHKQNIEGRLDNLSGKTGSDIENEANSMAGIILREYGQKNPNIYDFF